MRIQSEHEYEDLLGQWADLESGLGVILSNSAHAQEFVQRITQYDHWMQVNRLCLKSGQSIHAANLLLQNKFGESKRIPQSKQCRKALYS